MTLLNRAWCIVDKYNWEQEHLHLRKVFQNNGYSPTEINRVFNLFDQTIRKRREATEEPMHGVVVVVPFYQDVTDRLMRLLRHKQLRVTPYLFRKLEAITSFGKRTH